MALPLLLWVLLTAARLFTLPPAAARTRT